MDVQEFYSNICLIRMVNILPIAHQNCSSFLYTRDSATRFRRNSAENRQRPIAIVLVAVLSVFAIRSVPLSLFLSSPLFPPLSLVERISVK